MKLRARERKSLVFFLMSCLLCLAAFAQSSKTAILLVGDNGEERFVKAEKSIIQELKEQIVQIEKAKRPKVYSYHLSVAAEQEHCNKKLDITREDLPFIGIVAMENGAPTKVLYRRDRVIKYHRVVEDILSRANFFQFKASDTVVKSFPYFTGSDAASPESEVVTSQKDEPEIKEPSKPVPSESDNGDWRIQVGSYRAEEHALEAAEQLRDLGYSVKTDLVGTSNGDFYRVTAGRYETKTECLDALNRLRERGFEDAFPVSLP